MIQTLANFKVKIQAIDSFNWMNYNTLKMIYIKKRFRRRNKLSIKL